MKRSIILSCLLSLLVSAAFAQPKFTAKVKKSIFSVNTYDKQGNLLHQGTGFYTGVQGEAIANYKIFKDAYKAVVIDANGKQGEVECILGADDTYSLVRFRVQTKDNAPLAAVTAIQSMKSAVFAMNRPGSNAPAYDQATIADTALIQGKYAYYGLDKKLDESFIGAPVFNESGLLIGILHAPIGNKSYVLDIRFAEELSIAAIPSQSASVALNNIFIPKGLPDTQEEALVYLYFKSRTATNEEYMNMTNRFIATFPKNAEGYLRRATPLVDLQRFDEAENDLNKHLALVEDKAIGHFNVASVIFDKLRLQPEPAYAKWNYDVALQHVEEAIALNAAKAVNDEQQSTDTKYKILKGQILMNKEDYDGAIALYKSLLQTSPRTPSYLYAISLAHEGRGDSLSTVVEPLDSAIAIMGEPLPREAANYVIRRGQLYANNGKYRDAVQDYNQYCYLMNNKVSAVFYYERSQIEVNARMFQQALDDINHAVEMMPNEPLYHVEKAALTLRVNQIDECIQACQTAIRLNPSIIDAYRILGYAQLQKGDKANARLNLQKAIDMGDQVAPQIMETYLK